MYVAVVLWFLGVGCAGLFEPGVGLRRYGDIAEGRGVVENW